jgi:hypothetical protein
MADDLGYGDIACYGSKYIRPRISTAWHRRYQVHTHYSCACISPGKVLPDDRKHLAQLVRNNFEIKSENPANKVRCRFLKIRKLLQMLKEQAIQLQLSESGD